MKKPWHTSEEPFNFSGISFPQNTFLRLNFTISRLLFPFIIFSLLLNIYACQPGMRQDTENTETDTNPAAEGFDMQASDSVAIRLADEVMAAMGGRKAWDTTRYIAWNFFGARKLLWDKTTGDVRISTPNDSNVYLINIKNDVGKVMMDGQEITDPDSLNSLVRQGKGYWINDSYWLVMPFKLKDSGVTLSYLGDDTMQNGNEADVLELKFKEVGFTPDNKYKVYVDKKNHMVEQWAYFKEARSDTPNFVTPWTDYKKFGSIMLSGNRGQREITDIKVLGKVPDNAFTTFEPISL